jgi:hypothetical protein
MPGCGTVGHTVFDHQADSQLLDPFGVVAFGFGQIGQVYGETGAADPAAVA